MDGAAVVSFRSRADFEERFVFGSVIDSICRMAWEKIDRDEVMRVARAYYYFSIQFREDLEIARSLHPDDAKLAALWEGECDTDNLSPWPGIAAAGERMNHDEFMRRLLGFDAAGGTSGWPRRGALFLAKVRRLR